MRLLTIAFLAALPSALIAYAVMVVYAMPRYPTNSIDDGLHVIGSGVITFLVCWFGLVFTSVLGLAILRR
jgi:hypothetical protein